MARKMSFGYVHDFRNPPAWRLPWDQVYRQTLDFVVACEAMGFQSAWFAEHHGADDGYLPSPLIALAALAARTSRIRLGTAVALAPFYHPVRFAEDTALIDILSGGRFDLGLALGYRRAETDGYGLDFRRRASRMDEFFEIVPRLWAGEAVTFEGKHFALKDAVVTPRPLRGHIPMYIGGFSDAAIARAAKYGDGYFGNPELCDLYREKLNECGKDPAASRILIQDVFLVVARDPDRAREEIGPHLHYVNNVYGEWLNEDAYDKRLQVDTQPAAMPLEEFKRTILKVMTPDEACDMFQALDPQIDHVMMMVPPGMPIERFERYASDFASDVIPRFD